MSDMIPNIETALLAIQYELKAPKSQYNSFGKYSYRNCEDILEAVKPLLVAHGAALTLSDELTQIGGRYYIKATATLTNINNPVEDISVTAYAREDETKKGMDGSQVTGAASSYARKYALNGLFCIDDTKDADTTNTGSTPPAKAYKCEACGNDIQPVKRKDGTQWKADEMARFSQKKYGRCLCGNCMKAAEKKIANDIALAEAAFEAMHSDAGDRV